MKGAPVTWDDRCSNGCPTGGIDEVDAITIEPKCAGAFAFDKDVRPDTEPIEHGAHDSDLARHINRDDIECAPHCVGRLIDQWPVGGWRRVDAATVATFDTSTGQA
jgi:hypothetical protein